MSSIFCASVGFLAVATLGHQAPPEWATRPWPRFIEYRDVYLDGPMDLRIGHIDSPRPRFSQAVARFKQNRTEAGLDWIASLAFEEWRISEILVADALWKMGRQRSLMKEALAAAKKRGGAAEAKAVCATYLTHAVNTPLWLGFSFNSGASEYSARPETLGIGAVKLCPHWVAAAYLLATRGMPGVNGSRRSVAEWFALRRPKDARAHAIYAYALTTWAGSERDPIPKTSLSESARSSKLATEHYELAYRLDPTYDIAVYNVGCQMLRKGKETKDDVLRDKGLDLIAKARVSFSNRLGAEGWAEVAQEILRENGR
ncbi:MAG: hypothetical protein JST35_00900 [Armatimonadetes bacterium]|nr:hypothetical protein [Armatimonadota bacterium]